MKIKITLELTRAELESLETALVVARNEARIHKLDADLSQPLRDEWAADERSWDGLQQIIRRET